jgi:hypothetical protein
MPRPLEALDDGRLAPVPWSQGDAGFGVSDLTRFTAATEQSLCHLCGDHVAEGKVIVTKALRRGRRVFRKRDLKEWRIILDGGPLHDRCAKMTMAHCPHLKGNDRYVLVRYRE